MNDCVFIKDRLLQPFLLFLVNRINILFVLLRVNCRVVFRSRDDKRPGNQKLLPRLVGWSEPNQKTRVRKKSNCERRKRKEEEEEEAQKKVTSIDTHGLQAIASTFQRLICGKSVRKLFNFGLTHRREQSQKAHTNLVRTLNTTKKHQFHVKEKETLVSQEKKETLVSRRDKETSVSRQEKRQKLKVLTMRSEAGGEL